MNEKVLHNLKCDWEELQNYCNSVSHSLKQLEDCQDLKNRFDILREDLFRIENELVKRKGFRLNYMIGFSLLSELEEWR